MNNESKTKVKIFLILIIGIICFMVWVGIFYLISNKDNNLKIETEQNRDISKEQEKKYVTYSKLQTIILKDNSKWVVIKDSDNASDYVTVISTISYSQIVDQSDENISWIGDSNGKKLFKNTFGDFMEEANKDYKNSAFPKILEKIKSTYNLKLKNVDGYSIRLLTIEDIKEIDYNWKYESNYDSYTNTGNKDLSAITGTLTMSSTKCKKGKCNKLYNTYSGASGSYMINNYLLGYPDIKPVINVYKTEIKK